MLSKLTSTHDHHYMLRILIILVFGAIISMSLHANDLFEGLDQQSDYSADEKNAYDTNQATIQNLENNYKPHYSGGLYDSMVDFSSFQEEDLKELLNTKLSASDYEAPKGFDLGTSKIWNQIVEDLPKLINEIKNLQTIKNNDERTMFGISLTNVKPHNPRLSELEQSSAITSFRLIEAFQLLRQDINSDGNSQALIEDFATLLRETREAIGIHLQNISDMGSPESARGQNDLNSFMTKFSDTNENAEFFTIDKADQLSNQQIEVFSEKPRIVMNLRSFTSIQKPDDSSNQRAINKYRRQLLSSGVIKPSKSSKQKLRPRKYYVRKALRNSAGKPIALIVSNGKKSSTGFLIPVNDDNKRNYRVITPVAEVATSVQKVSSFEAFTSLLEPVKALTISRRDISSDFAANYQKFSIEDALQLRNAALKFYSDASANQNLLLGQKFENLKQIYVELDEIQNFLLSLGQQFEINNGKSGESNGKANHLFYIGSSQNLLAAVVSLICQKYQFDSSGRLVDGQTIKTEYNLRDVIVTEYAIVRQSRLGNFYSVGTNNSKEVMAYDNIHRGQYSMNYFIYTGQGEPKVGIQYIGLNYSRNNSNTYKVHVLNTQHPKFAQLKSELSLMMPDQTALNESVYYKLPLQNTQTFMDNPDIVIATHEVKSSNTKDDFLINLSGKVDKGELFAVYQEASGLRAQSRNQWVDYDEVLTHVFAWNCRAFEPVDKDSFRIIIDGSGTMKTLFKPVIEALSSEFKVLGMESFLTNKSTLKPLYYFGGGKAKESPYSLSSLKGSVKAVGFSPINLAVKQLICGDRSPCSPTNIPNKPWTLLIISDFDSNDSHFAESNWATSLAREGSNNKPLSSKINVESMMIKDTDGNYRVNSSAGGRGWKSLQAIHMIGVGPFLGPMANGKKLKAMNWMTNNQSLVDGSFGAFFSQISRNDKKALAEAIRKFLKPIADSIEMYESHTQQSAAW